MLASSVNLQIKFEPFAFVDALEARTLNRADVDKSVGLPIITHQETKTFHGVEEFDGTSCLLAGQFALGGTAAITAISAAISSAAATAAGDRNDISNHLKILRGYLATAINQIEFQRLAFSQTFQPGTLNRTDMDKSIFAAIILLDKAKAFLRIEELYSALAGAHNLRWHPVETTTAAATATARCAATETVTAATAETPATAATSAAETVTATIAIATKTALRFTTEWRETVFTETIALVAPPTPAPFVVTHNKTRTFVTPPYYCAARARTESASGNTDWTQ